MNRLQIATIQSIVVFLFILGWQLIGSFNLVSGLFLSSPQELLSGSWLPILPDLLQALKVTVVEIIFAFILAVLLGVGIGLLLGQFEGLHRILEPIIVWAYSIPKIAIYPIFMLAFGLGSTAVIVYAMLTSVFIILLNTITGVREVDRDLIRLSKSLGMNNVETYGKIMLPLMAPIVFSGLRQGLIQTVLGALVAELVMSSIGVGYLINKLTYSFATTELYAVISIIALGTIVLNFVLLWVERRLNFWRR